MVWLTEASTPEDLRIYAIGDIHGCLDDLKSVHDAIGEDLERNPTENWKMIHVGDYIDRGPESRQVIDYLIHCCTIDDRVVCLLGNHDLMFRRAVLGDKRLTEIWMRNGGETTLESYGLSLSDFARRRSDGTGFDDVIPPAHMDFIDSLEMSVKLGDYFFVHAGIDPDQSLDQQDADSMLWIRDRFIADHREYEAVIVHGHTPSRRTDVRSNRIGIDTGAVFGGDLTCLVLEGQMKARVVASGRAPLI